MENSLVCESSPLHNYGVRPESFFTLDRHVIKVNQVMSLIVIGYNEDTKIYFKNELFCPNMWLNDIKDINDLSEWRDAGEDRCWLRLVRDCSNTLSTVNGTIICHRCHAFYKSARNITDDEYNKYVLPILHYSSNMINSFTSDDNYVILTSSDNFNHFISIYAIEIVSITCLTKYHNSKLVHEYIKRRYIRRLMVFAKSALIKDIIKEIAICLIQL
jgi:hypothetical protein